MIIAPNRAYPVTEDELPSDRFAAWTEEVSRALNNANHPGFSQVIDPARGDATLSYTNGVLTRVTYADASTKDFNYTDGVLTSIVDSAGSDLAFVFNNGELTEINVS